MASAASTYMKEGVHGAARGGFGGVIVGGGTGAVAGGVGGFFTSLMPALVVGAATLVLSWLFPSVVGNISLAIGQAFGSLPSALPDIGIAEGFKNLGTGMTAWDVGSLASPSLKGASAEQALFSRDLAGRAALMAGGLVSGIGTIAGATVGTVSGMAIGGGVGLGLGGVLGFAKANGKLNEKMEERSRSASRGIDRTGEIIMKATESEVSKAFVPVMQSAYVAGRREQFQEDRAQLEAMGQHVYRLMAERAAEGKPGIAAPGDMAKEGSKTAEGFAPRVAAESKGGPDAQPTVGK